MKITIVTPSYNQAIYLERTIQSIWSQRGDFELEHIIADGGSTDESVDIINKFDELYRNGDYSFGMRKLTFKWWSKKDKGQTDAIMQGFSQASGDVLNWINSDDVLMGVDVLATVAKAFEENLADIVIGRGALIDENDNQTGEFALLSGLEDNTAFQSILPNILKGDFICQQSLFFKKALLEKVNLDPNYHYCMDWDLYVKCFKAGCSFYFVPFLLGALREQPEAKTQIMPVGVYKERLEIYRKNGVWSAGRIHSYLKVVTFQIPLLSRALDRLTGFLGNFLRFYKNRKVE